MYFFPQYIRESIKKIEKKEKQLGKQPEGGCRAKAEKEINKGTEGTEGKMEIESELEGVKCKAGDDGRANRLLHIIIVSLAQFGQL